MCGKNYNLKSKHKIKRGSPPRVREKLFGLCPVSVICGITPACAGKTYRKELVKWTTQDHPRVCGKNVWLGQFVVLNLGSPPRVREKPVFKNGVGRSTGITPACAGKTRSCDKQRERHWDHPRVCGKNRLMVLNQMTSVGSPPRVREKPQPRIPAKMLTGITPACAGKTDFQRSTLDY